VSKRILVRKKALKRKPSSPIIVLHHPNQGTRASVNKELVVKNYNGFFSD
jgi:hypothetical protein